VVHHYFKEDRQCTNKVILRRVRTIVVAVENQLVLHNMNMCSYS